MRVEFNRTGAERKALVNAVGEILETKAKYMGMPTAAYSFDGHTIDRSGALDFDTNIFPKDIDELLQELESRGFVAEGKETAGDEGETLQSENVGLTVSIPIEYVGAGNLSELLDAKGELIKKALGIKNTRFEIKEEVVEFPWFETMPDADTAKAYTTLISKLCEMSKKQKRINNSEKKVENEKYAFRCFLLRLGFIGDEYKFDRKTLLKNLDGSAAFKSGSKKEEANDEISK